MKRKDTFDQESHYKYLAQLKEKDYVIAHTDGSCYYKDRVGGYGIFLKKGKLEKRISIGPIPNTTVSRMELNAVLDCLRTVKKEEKLAIFSDSQYVVGTLTEWETESSLSYRKNSDIIGNIFKEIKLFKRKPKIYWIPGHKLKENEVADKLATQGRKRKKS